MNKPKILIVDDDTQVRKMLKDFFRLQLECEIQEAADGRQTLALLDKGQFDLILLDIKMPGISGMDVLKNTKAAHPQTDILILSGWDSPDIAGEVFKRGAVDYILKSSPLPLIQEKIFALLKKRDQFLPKKSKK